MNRLTSSSVSDPLTLSGSAQSNCPPNEFFIGEGPSPSFSSSSSRRSFSSCRAVDRVLQSTLRWPPLRRGDGEGGVSDCNRCGVDVEREDHPEAEVEREDHPEAEVEATTATRRRRPRAARSRPRRTPSSARKPAWTPVPLRRVGHPAWGSVNGSRPSPPSRPPPSNW